MNFVTILIGFSDPISVRILSQFWLVLVTVIGLRHKFPDPHTEKCDIASAKFFLGMVEPQGETPLYDSVKKLNFTARVPNTEVVNG